MERQLAWSQTGRLWHTRWISWESLGLPSETVPNRCLLVGWVCVYYAAAVLMPLAACSISAATAPGWDT